MTIAVPNLRAVICAPRWARNELWKRAAAYPSLDLQFADRKSLVDAISGSNLITFTRSGDATYVDSDGLIKTAGTNVPRFDHNPTTGESLGLLVEEQRTNLLTRSEDITHSDWTGIGVSNTANPIASPDGALTADLCEVSASGGSKSLYRPMSSLLNGEAYTFSFFAKAGNSTTLTAGVLSGSWLGLYSFNLTGAGSVTANVAGLDARITLLSGRYANGWYRCQMSVTATSTGFDLLVYPNNTSNTIGDSVYLWGLQLSVGAFSTSYIPTTSSAVTRNADVADIINTAIANGIRTLYAEFSSPASGTRGVASLNDNSANQRSAIITSGTDPRLVVVDGGVTQADIDAGTIAANTRSRMVVRINANDFSASFNGGAVVTDTSGTVPTVDRLFLGRTQAGEYLNAPIARLIGWTQALPDATLQAITQ